MDSGWTSDTENVHVDALCKTFETKARSFAEDHGRKRCPGLGQRWFLVPQHYDQSTQQDRERANLEARFSFRQLDCGSGLEIDTDAQLHKEHVISVRKEASSSRKTLQSKKEKGKVKALRVPTQKKD